MFKNLIVWAIFLVQAICSANESELIRQYEFVDKDLVDAQFEKMVGEWGLRAISSSNLTMPAITWKLDETGKNILISTPTTDPQKGADAVISHSDNSNIAIIKMNINGQDIVKHLLFLYNDVNYIIFLANQLDQSGNAYVPDTVTLEVLAKTGVDFDAEHIMELIFNNLMVKANVKRLIETHVYKLKFVDNTLNNFEPHPPRQFKDNEIANYTLDQLSGIYDVRYSTDEDDHIQYMIANHDNNQLKIKKIKGSQLVTSTVEYPIPNSRRVMRFARPVQQVAANVRSVPVYVTYLSVDNNTIITYEFCIGKENLRIYVKQGLPMTAQLQSVASSVLFKVRDLMGKLKPHYENKDQNKVLEFQIIDQYSSIEPEVEDVDLNKLVGNWTIRATSLGKKEPFYSHNVFEMTEQGLHVTKYNGAQVLMETIKSRLVGTKVLKSVPTNKPGLGLTYVIYLDNDYFICFGVRATQPGRPIWLKVYVKDGVVFDVQKELDLILKHVYSKPNLSRVLDKIVYDFEFLNQHLTDFWPRPTVHFDENELAEFNFEQIIGVYDLGYTSDSPDFKVPFNYTINSHKSIDKTTLSSYRMKGTEILQNITEAKLPSTRYVLKAGTTPVWYSPVVISRRYYVNYLYVDQNIYIVYEFCGFNPVKEHLRIYVRQGHTLSQEEVKSYLQKISPTALNKVNDMASKLRPHHMSMPVGPFIHLFSGIWRVEESWPEHVSHYDIVSFQIIMGNQVVLKKFLKGNQIDEFVLTNIKGTNIFGERSTKTGSTSKFSLAFTDVIDKALNVNEDETGTTTVLYRRVKPSTISLNIKFV